jgi:hypothetical protein
MIKITFPVLIALHFLWKPIAPSIAFGFILLAMVLAPAKNLLPRLVSQITSHRIQAHVPFLYSDLPLTWPVASGQFLSVRRLTMR